MRPQWCIYNVRCTGNGRHMGRPSLPLPDRDPLPPPPLTTDTFLWCDQLVKWTASCVSSVPQFRLTSGIPATVSDLTVFKHGSSICHRLDWRGDYSVKLIMKAVGLSNMVKSHLVTLFKRFKSDTWKHTQYIKISCQVFHKSIICRITNI